MAKTTLDVVGKGYRTIGLTHRCPACGSNNTYYSCDECAWVCYDCGEVFNTPASRQLPAASRTWLLQEKLEDDNVVIEDTTKEFGNLRDRLRRK